MGERRHRAGPERGRLMDLEYHHGADAPVDEDAHLPQHDWLLVPLIPLTAKEVEMLARGQRVVFKKLDIHDTSQVRGSAVYCARCQLPLERMTAREQHACRGSGEPSGGR